jgi:serine/threonine protein kinase
VQQPVPFGKYILLERISVGGMAEVFKAKSFGVKGFAKIIAIKKILPQLAEDAHFVDMFVNEAKTSVQLTHANICQIFDLGREGNDHFIAMEYISGKDLLSLHNYFRRTRVRMPIHLVAYIAARMCEGLDYAHRRKGQDGEPLGIVHRDVSPQNVIVSYDGGVKIIDFGIAKARTRNYQETQAGVLKGKFGYMSPEQIEGTREIDHRSDVFAIGTVVHELLTGKRLFLGDSDFATLEMVRNAEVQAPSVTNPEVPPELDAILFRALARDPDERYAWASDMADDLNMLGHRLGKPFAAQALGEWMVEHFAADIAKEKARHEIYAEIDGTGSPDDSVEADATKVDDPDLGPPGAGSSLDIEEEEETALWEPIEDLVSAPARPSPRHTRATENVPAVPPAQPETSAPPLTARPTLPGIPPRRGGTTRRDVLVAVLLVVLAGAGGVLAYRALDAQKTGGATAGLVVRVDPPDDVTIYVDNQVVAGRSPFVQKDLAIGPHALRVERTGYEPWVGQVTLRTDEVAEKQVTLKPVDAVPARVLFVVSPPDATVTVDGHTVTPAELASYLSIPSGRAVPSAPPVRGISPIARASRPIRGSRERTSSRSFRRRARSSSTAIPPATSSSTANAVVVRRKPSPTSTSRENTRCASSVRATRRLKSGSVSARNATCRLNRNSSRRGAERPGPPGRRPPEGSPRCVTPRSSPF